ncbi:MAG: hypothetical protein ACJATP_002783, partial [Candidatus Azotimanducaceae bacterium]
MPTSESVSASPIYVLERPRYTASAIVPAPKVSFVPKDNVVTDGDSTAALIIADMFTCRT